MKKVVIIGAGPAGITAGYELVKKSQDYEFLKKVTRSAESPKPWNITETAWIWAVTVLYQTVRK